MPRVACLIVALLIGLCMAAAVLAYNAYGIWGLAATFAIVCLLGFTLPKILMRFLTAGATAWMKREGRVLKGARVDLHRIEAADPSEFRENLDEILADEQRMAELREEFEDYLECLEMHERRPKFERWLRGVFAEEEDDEDLEHFRLDLTITPHESTEPASWSPHGLSLVPADERVTASRVEGDEVEEVLLDLVQRWDAGREEFVRIDDEAEFRGAHRLQFHAATPPAQRRYKLVYCFLCELEGEIELPPG